MSTIRYLVDLKNQRSFELGDRYYSTLFSDVTAPLSLSAIRDDLAEQAGKNTRDLYTPELAVRLYAFCVEADWRVELRLDNTEYESGRWGDDGFSRVGSVWDVVRRVRSF